jgi:hypothetical protein
MDIKAFATEHRLKLTKDGTAEDADLIIAGRVGQSVIYTISDTELGVAFMTDGKQAPRTGLFNTFKAACLEAGMTARQVGDAEGCFAFNPSNHKQAKVAIKGIRARVKKIVSPEQAAICAARLAAAREARERRIA